MTDWLFIALLAAEIAVFAFIGWKYPDRRTQQQRDEDDAW